MNQEQRTSPPGVGAGSATGEDREVELAAIMSSIAAGDRAAVFTLRDRFEPELARAVRAAISHRGARVSAQEVQDLVTDVAIVLGELARTWRPGSAPPWVWARHRIGAIVDGHIGQYASPMETADLEPVEAPPVAIGHEPDVLILLERVADHHVEAARLQEALTSVASHRDRMVFLDTIVQTSMGDPSPAVTVGKMHGLKPAAVRQQVRRVRIRVRKLAETDPRFEVLAGLAAVA